ncbi:hypothetical protein HJG60_010442 [Phyllostomus discolor]|uniref:Uncharacterized protein n=1 Tax=Phyllostomus discolor TaxID=89673 RepID=A0A834EHE5_9CHIR|nr:hypothetical protein HJG60_010442 [Phyllostomus discolor]
MGTCEDSFFIGHCLCFSLKTFFGSAVLLASEPSPRLSQRLHSGPSWASGATPEAQGWRAAAGAFPGETRHREPRRAVPGEQGPSEARPRSAAAGESPALSPSSLPLWNLPVSAIEEATSSCAVEIL